jgi:hypothetical protein
MYTRRMSERLPLKLVERAQIFPHEALRKLKEIRNIQRAQIVDVETLVVLRFRDEFCSLKVSVEPEPRPRCVMHAQLRLLARG